MNRPTYAEPTLDLFPDEADVELPLDEEPTPPTLAVNASLRDALAECLSWAEGRSTPNAERVRHWRTLVGRPAVIDEPTTPEERRDEGIARASAKWTDEEVALVDTAIRAVAARRLDDYLTAVDADQDPDTDEDYLDLLEFTTAHVWAELGTSVPVTKGIAGRMLAAKAAGIIANTGRTTILDNAHTAGPNHGQRLTVWRAR